MISYLEVTFMADKQISYKNFILQYSTFNAPPCQYINTLDRVFTNSTNNNDNVIEPNILNSMLSTIVTNIIDDIDTINLNNKKLLSNISKLNKSTQAFALAKKLANIANMFSKRFLEYKQINSIKITSQITGNNLKEVTDIIRTIEDHKNKIKESY